MERLYPAHPSNAEGPFYVVNNECVSCGAPEQEAPSLIQHGEEGYHCFFARQPETPTEVNAAIRAVWSSCCGALRYAGEDPSILRRLAEVDVAVACDKPIGRISTVTRDCVIFRYRAPETAADSALKQILNLLMEGRTSEDNRCSDVKLGRKEGSFLFRWYGENSIRFRVQQRPDQRWLIRLEENDVAKIGTAVHLDTQLQSNPLFTDIRWHTSYGMDSTEEQGWEHPY